MDLRECLSAPRRHPWLVLGALVGAIGIAGVVTSVTVPQYASSITFFVTPPGQDLQRVSSYAALLTGDRLATQISARRTVGLTAAEVRDRIRAQAVPGTVLIHVTVTDSSPERCERLAIAVAEEFIDLTEAIDPVDDASSVRVDVLSNATLRPTLVTPRPLWTIGLAGLAGLLAGLVLAVVREAFNITVTSAKRLRRLTGAPVLAVVPFDGSARRMPLAVARDERASRAEAIRHLRTSLLVAAGRPGRQVVLTSAVADEGKSSTAVNLAIACAELGRRILLIEADLRRPKASRYLGLDGRVGLSEVLAGELELDQVMQRWGRFGLYVVPSGAVPANPSEMLGSRRMASLLLSVRADFDLIIIDAPSLLAVADAAILTASTDGAILVARSGKARRARVVAAVERLMMADARLLGCVLNMQPGSVEHRLASPQARPVIRATAQVAR